MNQKELQQIVNPIYSTAKGTVLLLAGMGDKDAISLIPHVGALEEGVKREVPEDVQKAFMIAQRARYEIHNTAALRSDSNNIIDIPSGYAPRGFRIASEGKKYFGFDLPIVIDTMNKAVDATMTDEQKALSKYSAVDATNYESMKKALKDVDGEVCILTEGMLGYFSEHELVSFCQSVHKLLSEYGGSWITADITSLHIYPLTFEAVLGGDKEMMEALSKGIAANMADVKFYQNSLYLNGVQGAIDFLNEMGFAVKREPLSTYLPDILGVSPEVISKLREAYSSMEMFTLTVVDGQDNKPRKDLSGSDDLEFALDSNFEDGVLNVRVQGRIDTITAPKLLAEFKKVEDKAKTIKVDVTDVSYVSLAGLRVMKIMYDAFEDKDKFELIGASPMIAEMFVSTGHGNLL